VRGPVSRSKSGVQRKAADVFAEYRGDGKKHRYTPDVLVVWGSHREVVEIKGDRVSQTGRKPRAFCADQPASRPGGAIISRCGRPPKAPLSLGLLNASIILHYRRAAPERERIRRTLSSSPKMPVGAFLDAPHVTAVQSILRLVLDGTLYIDKWRHIDW
jgi:hypothetical protein